MDDVPFAQQILPRRQAAKQASANIAQQLDDSDSDATHTQTQIRVAKKDGRKVKAIRGRTEREPRAKDGLLSNGSGTATSTSISNSPVKAWGRREQALTKKQLFAKNYVNQDASDSELTSIVDTDPCSSPPATFPDPPSLTPRPFPLISHVENGANSSTAGTKRKHGEISSHRRRWKKTELGDFVWVLIDDHLHVYDHEDKAAQAREHLWWPGRISPNLSEGSKYISVRLYGETEFKVKNVEVSYPTEDNILPFGNSAGEAWFHEPTYVTPSSRELLDISMSPRKKAKRDRNELSERWSSALRELNTEQRDGRENVPGPARLRRKLDVDVHSALPRTSDDESLPEVGEDDWKASLASIPTDVQKDGSSVKINRKSRKGRQKGKRIATPISEGESDFGIEFIGEDVRRLSDEDNWSPPPPDNTLQIPGEIILAKGTGGDKRYWPARVLEYIPPKSKTEKEGKYKIEYLDGAITFVKRDTFFTPEEDEFATCKLGQFESSYDDVANDSGTEDPLGSLSQTRYPSPTPARPPPSQEVFCELDVRSQFVHTKPVLVAILNEQYPPARNSHDMFLKGGWARKSVVDGAVLRGEMDPRSVGELQRWLCEWCLRGERLAKKQDSSTGEAVEKGLELQNGKTDEAEPTDGFSQSTEAVTPPPSSDITDNVSLPAGEPLIDITMENTKPTEHLSPLSPLSESTPVYNENEDVKLREQADDALSDVVSDLTELDDIATPSTSALRPNTNGLETQRPPPRQYGCFAFEALTSMDKLDYCLNVLLPEAILQILLWRKGLRTTTELLSLDEEQRLHDEGEKLRGITDWVYDVVRFRRSCERRLAKKSNQDGSQRSDRGGGRLRSVGRINYVE